MKRTCIVCSNSQNLINKKSCLHSWLKEKISNDVHLNSLPCLNSNCKKELQVHKISSMFKQKSQREKVQQLLLNQYLKSSQDIKPCPNTKCKGYGFIDKGTCYSDLRCQYWDYSWFDKDHLSLTRKSQLYLTNCKSEILSYVMEFLKSQQCPKCEFRILKNGGCNHMTCSKCKQQFCWICKFNLRSDDHNIICEQKLHFNDFLIVYIVLNVMYSFKLFKIILLILILLYYFIIYNIWILLPLLIIMMAILSFNELNRYHDKIGCIIILLLDGLLIFLSYPIYLLITQYHKITFESYLHFNIIQLSILLILLGIYGIFKLYKMGQFRFKQK